MNEPILSPPPKPYEAYPGVTLADFAHDFLNNKPMTLQAFCMKEHIDPYELPRLVQEVLVDWELTEPRHNTRQDAVSHLINHLRIKIRNEQRTFRTQQYAKPPYGGQQRNPTVADLAREIYGEPSR